MSSLEETHLVHQALKKEGESTQKENPTDLIKGYLCALAFAIGATFSSSMNQVLEESVPSIQFAALQSFILIFLTGFYLLTQRQSPQLNLQDKTFLKVALVASSDIISCILYSEASKVINLGPLGGLHRASGLTISIILAKVLLNEDINALKLTAFVITVTGLVFFIVPIFLPNHGITTPSNSLQDPNCSELITSAHIQNFTFDSNVTGSSMLTSLSLVPGYGLIVIAGLINGADRVMISGYIHLPITVLAFWYGIFGAIISVLIMIYSVTPTLPSDPADVVLTLLSALGNALSGVFYIGSLYYISATKAAVSLCINLVLMVLIQYTFRGSFNDEYDILPLWLMCPGIIFIMIGVFIVPFSDIIIPLIYARGDN